MTARPLVLTGLMGVGKTSVAVRLAQALDRPLRDSDPDLTARYGATAAEQFARDGAVALHAREAVHLRQALGDRPPPVIAAAASVVDDPDCRRALTDAYVVWLHAPPEILAARINQGDHRPRYLPDLVAMLERQYEQRHRRFREVADVVCDVTDATPEQVAETVLAGFVAVTGDDGA